MSKLIPLYNRKGETVANAIVDDADFDWLSQRRWYLNQSGYAVRTDWHRTDWHNRKSTSVKMHRLILGVTTRSTQIDHINGIRLDNQRDNLRTCTSAQNAMNKIHRPGSSSQFKGVSWQKKDRKWQAALRGGEQNIYLGYFTSELEAAHAYDAAAVLYFGEFARLNFPQEQPQ